MSLYWSLYRRVYWGFYCNNNYSQLQQLATRPRSHVYVYHSLLAITSTTPS